ncbi:MAG: TonB-dependent receptor [Chitinophagales bacterium]|nr:TonB-dependent receptor [Chitinophagales bacterium]
MLTSASAQPSGLVTGSVYEVATEVALVGATIYIEDKNTGTVTDQNGHFQLRVPFEKDSVVLIISYVGYETQRIPITVSTCPCNIKLSKTEITAKEVVVTASRIPETILEAPVTILKMNAIAVKETPSENFYSALQGYKGVDVLTNSLLYKTLNTRGFNNNANFRLAQLVDGIDNSLVGLGWPLGNVLGITDLDVEKVEIIPGPASALYGANAFNGLLYTTTKDPFRYQGITAQVKNGVNHLGSDLHDPAFYTDLQLRYAKAFNDKFAFKVNFGYIRGSDWLLTDSSDIYLYVDDSQRGPDNPARDAVNILGDDVAFPELVLDAKGNPVDVSRTGYYVSDLIDNTTYSLKAGAGLEYKLNDRLQLSYAFNFAQATTSYSSISTFNLKDILIYSNKLELSGNQFFLRASSIANDLGETYSATSLAASINRTWKSNNDWFNAFARAYNGSVGGVSPFDLNEARNYADIGRLIPGTEAFNHVADSIRAVHFGSLGALVIDRSSKYSFQGEYDFNPKIKVLELIAGADYRLTRLNSEGTIFIDEPGEPLMVNQYAAYVQAGKKILNDRLKLLASLRYDKADNFKGVWAPRFAAVYHPDNNNYFRASWQSGFRIPDPQLQYMDISFTPTSHRLGGTALVDKPYNSRYNSFTKSSADAFLKAVDADTSGGTYDEIINRYVNLLEASPYDYIEPEKVQTFEAGYRRLLFDKKVYFDVNYFHNSYTGFIFTTVLVQTKSGGPGSAESMLAAAKDIDSGKVENFTTVVNSEEKVTVNGIEVGTSIVLPRGYLLSGNFTWIQSNVEPEKNLPGLRTPEFKSNVSISNPHVFKQLGFMVNWRWTDAVYNWSNVADESSIDNNLPAYSIIDAQVSYRIPKAATSIKAGASNLLNYYHQDYAQGISVGGIYYVSLLYDGIFK